MDSRIAGSLLDFVRQAGPRLSGSEARAVLEQVEERYPDLQAAMIWFTANDRATDAIRLAGSLSGFWMATKRLEEGLSWLDRVLQTPGADDSVRGRGCFQAGLLATWLGEDDRASAFHAQALELGRRAGDATGEAQALTGLARISLRSGDTDQARRLCREALAAIEGTDDWSGRSNALHVLGVAAQMAGDFLEAREVMTDNIALLRQMGREGGVASEASNLSMVERQLGELDRAEELSREALEIYWRRSDEWSLPWALNGLAAIALARGRYERAARLVGAAETMVGAQGSAWPPDERPHYEKTVAGLQTMLGEDAWRVASDAGRQLTTEQAVACGLDASRDAD